MGSKLAAKEAAKKFDVPMVPGIEEAITDVEMAKAIGRRVGYPILIKASAGGGGKGMRAVYSVNEFDSALGAARREALNAFGNDEVYLEKLITSARHIEFQILADTHGNTIHLGERECSIQRRHQKLIEESPSVALDEHLRQEMGKVAVAAAEAAGVGGKRSGARHSSGTLTPSTSWPTPRVGIGRRTTRREGLHRDVPARQPSSNRLPGGADSSLEGCEHGGVSDLPRFAQSRRHLQRRRV